MIIIDSGKWKVSDDKERNVIYLEPLLAFLISIRLLVLPQLLVLLSPLLIVFILFVFRVPIVFPSSW